MAKWTNEHLHAGGETLNAAASDQSRSTLSMTPGGGGGSKVYSLWEWPTDLGLQAQTPDSKYGVEDRCRAGFFIEHDHPGRWRGSTTAPDRRQQQTYPVARKGHILNRENADEGPGR
jgi:hypothetical protein